MEGKRSKNSQKKKKVRESSFGAGEVLRRKRVKCYKTLVPHDHESVNHSMVACRGSWIALWAAPLATLLLKYHNIVIP